MSKGRKAFWVAVLTVIAALYIGDIAYRNLYAKPLEAEERRTTALKDELTKIEVATRVAQKKIPQLDGVRAQSLPTKTELAASVYRDWLFKMLKQHGLTRPQVDSGQPVPLKNIYRRISFSVRGSGTLPQVTRFLHAFYETGFLHKIRSMTLTPNSLGRVDMSVSIEALSLTSGASDSELGSGSSKRLAFGSFDDYQSITRRNLFGSGGNSWLQDTQLTAITINSRGNMEAWFNAKSTSTIVVIEQGAEKEVAGHSIKVLAVDGDSASISIDGDQFSMQLGQSLKQAVDSFNSNELASIGNSPGAR